MRLNLKQLKYLRGVLSIARMYKPYEDRGDVNAPKGSLWNVDLHDLFVQIEAEISRRFPKCTPWSPYGQFSDIIEESKKLNESMTLTKVNQLTLTDDELRVVEDLLTFVTDIGLPSDIEDNEAAYDSLFNKVFGEYE